MSEQLRTFTRGIYAFDAVVQRVPTDKWAAQTPCPDWNAAQLVEHQCAVLNGVAAMAETGGMAAPTPSADNEPAAMWNECRDRVLAALDTKGALAQEGPFWFKAATIDDVCGAVLWDPVTHAWDLATAAGIEHGLADDLLEATLATVEPRMEMLAKSERTAAPIEVGADASMLQRYLATVGRSADHSD